MAMKKTNYLLASIIACSPLLADDQSSTLTTQTCDPCNCEPPACPCIPSACMCTPPIFTCGSVIFELTGQVLVLQPNGTNLYYAAEAIPLDPSISVPPASPNWKIFEIDPDYRVGFLVAAALLFYKCDTYISLDWERLHTSDSESKRVPIDTDMIGPLFDIGPNSANYKVAHGKARFHFDEVDLHFGKSICFPPDLQIDLYAGVTFARIKQFGRSRYNNDAARISRIVEYTSTFIGAGPQFGADFDYRLWCNFSCKGSTSIALVVGSMRNHTTFLSTTPELGALGIPSPNSQETSVPHRTQLVPGFIEKLGLSYAITCNCFKIDLGIGYQAQIYLDAVQSIDMTAPQVLPALVPFSVDVGVFAVGFERTLSNFILTGPYASVDIEF